MVQLDLSIRSDLRGLQLELSIVSDLRGLQAAGFPLQPFSFPSSIFAVTYVESRVGPRQEELREIPPLHAAPLAAPLLLQETHRPWLAT